MCICTGRFPDLFSFCEDFQHYRHTVHNCQNTLKNKILYSSFAQFSVYQRNAPCCSSHWKTFSHQSQKEKENHKRFWLDHHLASQSNYIYTVANINFCIQLRKKNESYKSIFDHIRSRLGPLRQSSATIYIHSSSQPF